MHVRLFSDTQIYFIYIFEIVCRGPFLQSPDNFWGPKSNIQIEIKRIEAKYSILFH